MSKISARAVEGYTRGEPIPFTTGSLLTKAQLLRILYGTQAILSKTDELRSTLNLKEGTIAKLHETIGEKTREAVQLETDAAVYKARCQSLEKKVDDLTAMIERERARQMDILRIAKRFFGRTSEDRSKVALEFASGMNYSLGSNNDNVDDLVKLIMQRVLEVGV